MLERALQRKILVIEDEPGIAFALRRDLERQGYDVDVARDGEVGVAKALKDRPHVVLLDLMLPRINGFDVLKAIRSRLPMSAIIIVSALVTEADILRGFALGADDYLTKPFSLAQLGARVSKHIERYAGQDVDLPETFHVGDVIVDSAKREVRKDNSTIPLAPMEFELLARLWLANGAVVTKVQLLQDVWHYPAMSIATVETRTVDHHIGKLRRKIEADPQNPRHIITVRKIGYKLLCERSW
jgi:DNA-binding response OmpR family regulator